jgi:catechol 2,3-dioxygenase-like lactoylglutathione lyase family enzyme
MAIQLNHTIVAAHDKDSSATFLVEVLGLPAPSLVGPFAVVRLSDDTSLDYIDAGGEITSQHYAFLVNEAEFDEIFARIRERRLSYWADPSRRERDHINTWDGGRGLYFDDPNGHLLEIITRPYGSGGTTSSRPHPLFAPEDHEGDRSGHQGKNGGKASPLRRDRRGASSTEMNDPGDHRFDSPQTGQKEMNRKQP